MNLLFCMNSSFPVLSSTGRDISTLSSSEIKKLPFYMVTADPFGATAKWEGLMKDQTFLEALSWVMDLNISAIRQNEAHAGVWNHVHYGFDRPDKPLQLHSADISLKALMLSLEWTIRTQIRTNELTQGNLVSSDLSNLHELFGTVSKSKPRTYHDAVIQMLRWFYEVRYQYYEYVDVKSLRDEEFRDFERIGWSIDGIRERVKHLHNGKLYFEIGREGELVFDFRNATTELVINHWNYRKREILEAIQRDNPFVNQDRVNILFPLRMLGWTIPLINLTKITVENWNGQQKEQKRFEWAKNPRLQSWSRWKVQSLLELPTKL